MKVKVRGIPSQGLEFYQEAMPKGLDLCEEFLDEEKPIIVEGFLQRVDDFILAKLKVTYTADTVCSRCLDPIEGLVSFDLPLEIEFNPGDEFIDLGMYIREEILMRYAPSIVCKEDCKGICPNCGVYLNTEDCECQKENKE